MILFQSKREGTFIERVDDYWRVGDYFYNRCLSGALVGERASFFQSLFQVVASVVNKKIVCYQ